ncbi:bola-like protein [Fomitiporia mediterranea MF3/22]|uniref:bola-like protein n=1 Tax=Fomitiporia mediterranea (strain MF3/22) TaxID=694068 RepID=UPI0004409830|nr:bola-like protein [Fomitiporia mediterranea MF3/22]EJD01271.1 bola-like protein [Fomitiporia mediterranea MF3/22]
MYRIARHLRPSIARLQQSQTPIVQWRYYSVPPRELKLEGERLIYSKLHERFNPSRLQVQDVSGGCGTFYAITIASKAFADIPMVQQHRLVNKTLKEEIEGIHGLQVSLMYLCRW